MHYDAQRNDHGLPHDPIKALIAPRPIGWISSLDKDGTVNLAPYSFFNAFSSRPTIVGFSSENIKDSQRNIEATKEFVCNIASLDLAQQMNATSASVPSDISEMQLAGLSAAPSHYVKPPRVLESPAALECRYLQSIPLVALDGRPTNATLILGQVVGVYIDERFIENGMVQTAKMQPLARCGYFDYVVADKTFSLKRPG